MTSLSRFVRSGLVFDVREGGSPHSAPVVLLHGFPQDSSSWNAVALGLQATGLRTLSPDLRGYSPQARPPGRKAYALRECADDVLALLDAAGLDSAHLVGHDWGGALAWYLAGRNPHRVRTLTVLSTPHPTAMRLAFLTSTQALKSWYMALFQLPFLPERYLSANPERVARSLRLAAPGAARAALGWYRAIPFTLRDPVHSSPVPTSYLWGRQDPFLGRFAAEATAHYVTGDYRFIESNSGHWLPETRPAETTTAILERIAASSPAAS